ncbi:MAG: tetratricopeptide repeat protein, partial [Thermoguttaceae bacterium]|nr:tetratricopeptide repeat protein [Thermoguttaceae bacterium]
MRHFWVLVFFVISVLSFGWTVWAETAPNAEELYRLGEKWATADHGQGTQDWTKAAEYYRQAAELGHARAMVELGSCYYYGRGVERDTQKWLSWNRKAADLNDPWGFSRLGMGYEDGEGVPKDEDEAKRWYEKAFQTCYAQKDSGDPW